MGEGTDMTILFNDKSCAVGLVEVFVLRYFAKLDCTSFDNNDLFLMTSPENKDPENKLFINSGNKDCCFTFFLLHQTDFFSEFLLPR